MQQNMALGDQLQNYNVIEWEHLITIESNVNFIIVLNSHDLGDPLILYHQFLFIYLFIYFYFQIFKEGSHSAVLIFKGPSITNINE